jgi:hypothetical protein
MSAMWRRRSRQASPAPETAFERLRRERELLRRAAGYFAEGVAPGRPRLRLVHPAPRR